MNQSGELGVPEHVDPRTLADCLAVIRAGGPEAVEAALLWCSARTDSALRDLPDAYRRVATNSVDRAGNELRAYLGWPQRPVTYEQIT